MSEYNSTIAEETELMVKVEDGRVGLLEVPEDGCITRYSEVSGYEIEYLTNDIPEDGIYTAFCRCILVKDFEGALVDVIIAAYNFTRMPMFEPFFDNSGKLMYVSLNKEQSIRLAELLNNPPAPNGALKEAKKRYDELVAK